MKTKTDEEWEAILTPQFLHNEYVVKRVAINHIAHNIGCGILRVRKALKKCGITRKRVANNRRISNIQKLERMGFQLLEEYTDSHKVCSIKCYCGRIFHTTPHHILTKHTKSCGCFIANKHSPTWGGYEEISGKEFNKVRFGAVRRNIQFSITIEEIWSLYLKQDRKCALSGLDIWWGTKDKISNASIDRIDNNKPYNLDNIQILHKDVNMMKRHHSNDYIIYLCQLCGNNSFDKSNFLWWEKENLTGSGAILHGHKNN